MAAGLIAPLIGAGASLLGSKLSGDSAAKAARLNAIYQSNIAAQANAQNEAQFQQTFKEARRQNAVALSEARRQLILQQRADLHDEQRADAQFRTTLAEAEKDRAMQREFAQNGVQWRAADARMAGLHPLAAMGAQLASSSPVQVGSTASSSSLGTGIPSGSVPSGHAAVTPSGPGPYTADGVGSALAASGQDISRAMMAVATEYERTHGVQAASQQLALENQSLQNKYLAAQIAKISGPAVGPPFPSSRGSNQMPGQGNTPFRTPLVQEQPHKPVAAAPGADHSEPGSIVDVGYAKTPTGYTIVPSKDVKERIEDNIISETWWEIRNRLAPMVNPTPPTFVKLKPGERWIWNPAAQEYQITTWKGFSPLPPLKNPF